MSKQHTNAARTRARRRQAVETIKAADGGWVDLPQLGAIDLLALRDDMAIEVVLVPIGNGYEVPRARYNPAHAEEYAKLVARFQEASKGWGRSTRATAEYLAAAKALSDFREPRRVG